MRRERRKGVYMCEEGEWGINEEGRKRWKKTDYLVV